MNRSLVVLTLSLVASLTLPASTFAGEAPSSSEGTRDFRITYRTKVPVPAEGAKRIEAWVPVPFSSAVQEVRDLAVHSNAPFELRVDPTTGNRMVHVLVNAPTRDVTIDWTAIVRRHVEAGQEQAASAGDGRYLQGAHNAPVDAKAKALVAEIGANAEGTSVRERAARIWDHVLANTAYDKTTPGWGTGDFERVCRVGKGNCSDFTARFVTLARAAGIPARWVSTIALSEDHAGCDACGYHCYGYFLDEGRWVPVDPSDARRIQDKDAAKADWYFGHAARSNVILSVGRDLTLVPRQQGKPISFFWGPYVEIDGKATSLAPENRRYEYEALKAEAPAAASPEKDAR